MRLRTLSVALSSILMVAACATTAPAVATTTAKTSTASLTAGGAASGSTGTSSGSSTSAGQVNTSVAGGAAPTSTTPTTTPAKSAHHAPITAPTPNITYHGPVYEKTTTGQIVPYTTSSTTTSTTSGASGNASASSTGGDSLTASPSTTGGSPTGGSPISNSGTGAAKPDLLVPGHTARIIDGLGAAPMDAPAAVQEIIWAGNQIVGLPYIYGGGHASFISPGYDCSGTVSYALHGADLLSTPMDSTEFEGWGGNGVGTWVTIFANGGHAYMTVAGIRLDTSSANDPSNLQGPRWRPLRPENAGFVVRHPTGL